MIFVWKGGYELRMHWINYLH